MYCSCPFFWRRWSSRVYKHKKVSKFKITTIVEWGPTSWFIASVFLLCHMEEGARKLCGVSFIRPLIPFMRSPPSWPNQLPKLPPSTTITLDIRIPARGYGRTQSDHSGDFSVTLSRRESFPEEVPFVVSFEGQTARQRKGRSTWEITTWQRHIDLR